MNTKKLFGVGSAALLVLVTVLSLALTVGANPDPNTGDENLSRTFLWFGGVEWKVDDEVGGVGWYSQGDRNENCLFRLFGLRFGSGFYYPRETVNPNVHVAEVQKTMVNVGCPLPFADEGEIGTTGFNVYASGGVTQSHLLCAGKFETCVPDDTTSRWVLFVCKPAAGKPTFAQGDLFDLGLNLGSESTGGCPNDQFNAVNATAFLDDDALRQSGFTPLHLDQLWKDKEKDVANDDSAYVVSCFETDYEWVGNTAQRDRTASSHDFFLVLKGGDQGAALLNHYLGPHLLKGWYDLSGDNGCPHDMDGHPELDPDAKKAKSPPLVTVPGAGKV